MKSLTAQLSYFVGTRRGRRNIRVLISLVVLLAGMIAAYSVLFHYLMAWEFRHHAQAAPHSWITGLYWTLTVMTTLGFGDITFQTDLGRVFSVVVLLSGVIFLLILLPFTLIQFFFAPWLEAQQAARAPRVLPAQTSGHVILTHYGPVTESLIQKLTQFKYAYVLLAADLEEALKLSDLGVRVMVGALDDPDSYRHARVERAALVAATADDATNANIALSVREVSESIPIITLAREAPSVDILRVAGSTHVLQLDRMMGESLARRAIGGNAMTHVIGNVDEVYIAEANATRTPLVGKSLRENRLSELGVTVIGLWERGQFQSARPETVITPNSVLMLAGSREALQNYDEHFAIYNVSTGFTVILGGGHVGQATAHALAERGIECRIVDLLPPAPRAPLAPRYVVGNAAELDVLEQAGIGDAANVVVTTRDDNTNIYLTILCRRLRPEAPLISRATLPRNVPTLHRAGADFVMSYASMGSNAIFNLLERSDILMVAEGLDILRLRVPAALAGQTLVQSGIRAQTGCSVIAVSRNGRVELDPSPAAELPADAEMTLIGSVDSHRRFMEVFGAGSD